MSYLEEVRKKKYREAKAVVINKEDDHDDTELDADDSDTKKEPKAENPKKGDKKKKAKKTIAFKEFDPAKYIEINPVTEATEGDKAVVTTFGRMNPPTNGHEKLVFAMKKQGRKRKADVAIYLSHSQDAKKNPLGYKDKIKYTQQAFGDIIQNSKARNIIEVLKELDSKYALVTIVVGSDRVKEFDTLANKYNGKEYNFKSIEVVSAGERDPDSEGIEGMSASKMRKLVADDNFPSFHMGLPDRIVRTPKVARKMFNTIRDEMGLKKEESIDFDELLKSVREMDDIVNEEEVDEALNPAQRRARSLQMKKMSKQIARKRKQSMKKQASPEKLKARAEKAARNLLKKKIAAGKDTGDLSFSQRQKIDDKVKKIGGAKLKTLAKKLLPQIKTKEKERIKAMRSKKEEVTELMDAVEHYMSTEMLEEHRHAKIYTRPHQLMKQDHSVKIDYRFKTFRRWKPEPILATVAPELDEVQQDGDVSDKDGSQPKKYYSGLDKKTKEKRDAHFKRKAKVDDDDPKAYTPAPGDADAETKPSKHTKKYHQMFGELSEDADTDATLRKKAKETGISYDILKKVFDRGVAAWRTGHRPGTNPVQWGFARVNSYATKGKTYHTTDSDLRESVEEGVNDPAIFKAIFLAGGPGSGKSFVVGKTALTALGMRVVNVDDAFELAMKKAGLSLKTDTFTDKGQEIRGKASDLTGKKQEMFLKGRLGLVIDGTGKDYKKIKEQADTLKELGYDVGMIFVNTDRDTALKRNAQRERSLPPKAVDKMWQDVQKNLGRFQGYFRKNFIIVDNSVGANWEAGTQKAYKWANKFTRTPPTSPEATKWIKQRSESIEEDFGSDGLLMKLVPWIARWADTKSHKKQYARAVRTFLDLRKKNPKHARQNLVKAAQINNVDTRALDKFFRAMVDKGLMPAHLINYHPTFMTKAWTEEGGAGEEGTDKLVKRYKSDTPGE